MRGWTIVRRRAKRFRAPKQLPSWSKGLLKIHAYKTLIIPLPLPAIETARFRQLVLFPVRVDGSSKGLVSGIEHSVQLRGTHPPREKPDKHASRAEKHWSFAS